MNANEYLISDFQRNYEHFQRQYKEASVQLLAAKKLRDDNCPHENLEKKVNNVEGGYLNKGYSETWHECILCHAKSEVIRKSDGHYG